VISPEIKRQLKAIDWDFPSQFKGTTKSSHWYPGSFPSQMPSSFIQALSNKGDLVFDPYGGSGTTAGEALRLHRKAWTVDINPIGTLTSYVYCSLLLLKKYHEEKFCLFFKFVDSVLDSGNSEELDLGLSQFDYENLDLSNVLAGLVSPAPNLFFTMVKPSNKGPIIESLAKWFSEKTLKSLLEFHENSTEKGQDDFVSLFFEAMISSNLRGLCSQTKSWGHIADNVYPKEFEDKNVLAQLRKWNSSLKNSIDRISFEKGHKLEGINYWCSIHNWMDGHSPQIVPDCDVNLIVTSPPYADAIDYIYAQKLSLYFLGFDDKQISSLCGKEIGARRRRAKSNSRVIWAEQLAETVEKQISFMRNGVLVEILPHKDSGREIGLNFLTAKLEGLGWEVVFEIDRSINQKKTRQSWTSIKKETIKIFKEES
jgi:hypothetical protein